MNTYEKYKDSGVEWIGEIPSHWDVSRIKYHYDLVSGFPFDSEDITNEVYQYPVIRIGNVSSGNVDVYFSGEPNEKHPIVRRGDLIVSLTGDFSIRQWNNVDSVLNQRCGLIRNRDSNVLDRVVFYQVPFSLNELGNTKYFTTLKNLSNSEFLDINLVVPPLPEQHQIVSFLDEKTSLIDDLINKKEQKIGLLKEYRTSLINRVITKGLNPDCPMKESGIEWIGMIPSHWECVGLGIVSNGVSNGSTTNQVDEDTGFRVSRIETISSGRIDTGRTGCFDYTDEMNRYSLNDGDILLSHINSLEMVGNCAIYDSKQHGVLYHGMNLLRVQPRVSHVVPQYLLYTLKSSVIKNTIMSISKHSINQVSVPVSSLRQLRLLLPPLPEQHQIVSFLDEKTGEIDRTIQSEQKKIELLKEYRQSLISSVITGKIKVVN